MATVQGELATVVLSDLLDVLLDPKPAGVPGRAQSRLGTGGSALCGLFWALASLQAQLLHSMEAPVPPAFTWCGCSLSTPSSPAASFPGCASHPKLGAAVCSWAHIAWSCNFFASLAFLLDVSSLQAGPTWPCRAQHVDCQKIGFKKV